MIWTDSLNGDTLCWLLERDQPGVCYLDLRDLLDLHQDTPEFHNAHEKAHREGPIATILNEMAEEGYWVEPGPG